MNEHIQATMRRELSKAAIGTGFIAGSICFGALVFIASKIPGMQAFENAHNWVSLLILAVSVVLGWLVTLYRQNFLMAIIERYDDDTLKYKYDEMKRKELKSSISFYIIVALVVAYFIFKR